MPDPLNCPRCGRVKAESWEAWSETPEGAALPLPEWQPTCGRLFATNPGLVDALTDCHRATIARLERENEGLRETVRKRELEHLEACAEADELRALLAKVHAEIGGRASHGPAEDARCTIDWIATAKELLEEYGADVERLERELARRLSQMQDAIASAGDWDSLAREAAEQIELTCKAEERAERLERELAEAKGRVEELEKGTG